MTEHRFYLYRCSFFRIIPRVQPKFFGILHNQSMPSNNTGFDVTGLRNRQRSLFRGAILYRRVLASRIFNHRPFHPLSNEIVLAILVILNVEETL